MLSIDLFGDLNPKDWPISNSDLPIGSALCGGSVRVALLNKLCQKPDLDIVVPTKAIEFSENLSKKIKTSIPGSMPVVQKAFETIGFAKVGTSAKHAQSYGYLRDDDLIVVNRDHILDTAKKEVLSMKTDYIAPKSETFKLAGSAGRLAIKAASKGYIKSGKISEHDALIGEKLAYVLTGGSKGGPFSAVDEQYLLDIEREAFVSLCGEQKSIDRIAYMLTRGKPLRN